MYIILNFDHRKVFKLISVILNVKVTDFEHRRVLKEMSLVTDDAEFIQRAEPLSCIQHRLHTNTANR